MQIPPWLKRDDVAFIGITVVALVIRLLHLWEIDGGPLLDESALIHDTQYYLSRANEIADGDWQGHDAGFLSPLYNAFIAACFTVMGREVLYVKALQALIGAVCSGLLYFVGKRLFSPVVGVMAGLGLAAFGPQIFYGGLLFPATLLIFFHLVFILALFRLSPDTPWANAGLGALAGFAIGLAALGKANALLVVGWGALWCVIQLGWRQAIAPAAALVLASVLTIAPVTYGNYVVSGEFVLITTTEGSNLVKGNGPTANGSHVFINYDEPIDLGAHVDRITTPGRVARWSVYLRNEALTYMWEHKRATARLWLKKLALSFHQLELGNRDNYHFWQSELWLLRLPWLGFAGIGVFGVLGASMQRPNRDQLLVLGIAAAQIFTLLLIFVLGRYRVVLVACLLPFAGHAIHTLATRFREIKPLRWAQYLLTIAALTAVAFWPHREFKRTAGWLDQHKYLGDYYSTSWCGWIECPPHAISDPERALHHYKQALKYPPTNPRLRFRQRRYLEHRIEALNIRLGHTEGDGSADEQATQAP